MKEWTTLKLDFLRTLYTHVPQHHVRSFSK